MSSDLWNALVSLLWIVGIVAFFGAITKVMMQEAVSTGLFTVQLVITVALLWVVPILLIQYGLGPPVAKVWNACSDYTSKHKAVFLPLWIASDFGVAFCCARRMYFARRYCERPPPSIAFAIGVAFGVAFAALMFGMRWALTLSGIDLSSYAITLLFPGSLVIVLFWIIIKEMDEKGLL